MPLTDKKELRRKYKKLRNALSKEERSECSRIICEKLTSLIEGKRFLSYAPISSEVDVSSVNQRYHAAYPHLLKDHKMEALLPQEDTFVINDFGIAEPDPGQSKVIDPKDLEVIIVPLLAFDEKKQRLGYGGGYYDRYLKNTDAIKIGVAYEIQKTEEHFKEEHDVPMDMIITEKSIY